MTTGNKLHELRIASPCPASWDAMTGDDTRRHCAECRLDVYNLSAMTTAEAEAILAAAGGGRLCVRLYRRQDGTVLTRDCPVGLRRRVRRAWARCAALVGVLLSGALGCVHRVPEATVEPVPAGGADDPIRCLQGEVVVPETGDVAVPQAGQGEPRALMGRIAAPEKRRQ